MACNAATDDPGGERDPARATARTRIAHGGDSDSARAARTSAPAAARPGPPPAPAPAPAPVPRRRPPRAGGQRRRRRGSGPAAAAAQNDRPEGERSRLTSPKLIEHGCEGCARLCAARPESSRFVYDITTRALFLASLIRWLHYMVLMLNFIRRPAGVLRQLGRIREGCLVAWQ